MDLARTCSAPGCLRNDRPDLHFHCRDVLRWGGLGVYGGNATRYFLVALGIGEIPAEHGAVGGTHSSTERSKKSSASANDVQVREENYPSMDPANVLREATELILNQAFRLTREMSFPSKDF